VTAEIARLRHDYSFRVPRSRLSDIETKNRTPSILLSFRARRSRTTLTFANCWGFYGQ
jgi:hypothetical protein